MTTPPPKKLNTLNIRAYAAKHNRSLSNMIQTIVAEWLEEQEKKS
jgi:hypothetical protein